ncbi:MAG: DUF58 domain-containing protein [Flavobacteriaceae bacterium]|nr:DUF58 domain-containing protein [Flavobacteriaceae bacterium]
MKLDSQIEKVASFNHLELLANQIVEGFISGMHKSPFHGFSAEFAEHKIYNLGESTKHIDWKLFAKTDRLYTKRFEEETNMRCHLIIDNSSSMHYPELGSNQEFYENKIGFSVLASACLMNLLKKQRDAVGLSVYSDEYEYYSPEKGSDRHHRMILNFTDMFQQENEEEIFKALQHLKHNKHKVVVFHVYDKKTEFSFDFDASPKKFVDVETGETINLFSENLREEYENIIASYFEKIKLKCLQYRIQYVPVEIGKNFEKILLTYLTEKQKFG